MLKRIIASAEMATATQATRAGRSQRPRRVMAGGEVRVLILPFTQLCSLDPSSTTPLYSTTISHPLRETLRETKVIANFLENACLRTSENTPSTHSAE